MSSTESGMSSGMLRRSFLYISTNEKMQRSMCGVSTLHIRENVSRWRSSV